MAIFPQVLDNVQADLLRGDAMPVELEHAADCFRRRRLSLCGR
jgi:hypothetical protein